MKRPSLLALSILFAATIILATGGWLAVGESLSGRPIGPFDAVYRALLAFVGADMYVDPPNMAVSIARFTGLLTAASAILLLTLEVFRDRWLRFCAARRKGHIVIVGISPFVLAHFRAKAAMTGVQLTIIDHADVLPERGTAREAVVPIALAADPGRPSTYLDALGRTPDLVVFGDREEMRNLERALAFCRVKPDLPMCLRIESELFADDVGALAPELGKATRISEASMVARALVTRIDFPELAQLRGQDRVHLGIVGMGRIGLAIAEEVALRCRAPADKQIVLSIFDKDPKAASQRIALRLPALGNVVELRDPASFDGLMCGLNDNPLLVTETERPLTALVLCTGDDATNTAIAMKLHHLRVEHHRARFPILLHARDLHSFAPAPVQDLSGGIVFFGGTQPTDADLILDDMIEKQAIPLHDAWRKTLSPERVNEDRPWENLGSSMRRSSLQAALSIPDLLREAGFMIPGPESTLPNTFAAAPGAVVNLLNDTEAIERLARLEHNRWMAERWFSSWRPALDGSRDDVRRLHDCMKSYEALDEDIRERDRKNVRLLMEMAAKRGDELRSPPPWPFSPRADLAWKWRRRIGFLGPLVCADDIPPSLEADLEASLLQELDIDARDLMLEIVTPDAPGFDRLGATMMAQFWRRHSGRPACALFLRMAPRPTLDGLGEGRVPLQEARDQTSALEKALGDGFQRSGLVCPIGEPPRALSRDHPDFAQRVRDCAECVSAVSDILVAYLPDGRGEHTRAIVKARQAEGRPTLVLDHVLAGQTSGRR